MGSVGIVDYGLCNLDSVARAVEECGGTPLVTERPADLKRCSHIIMPGVGAFPDAMRNLRERGLDDALTREVLEHGIPFLGICLGMQLMATVGAEREAAAGLGWIAGQVVRLEPTEADRRVPHVGWNEVQIVHPSRLFQGVPSGTDFYFVHSYHLVCRQEEDILARTPYCGGFASAVARGNVLGVQFHPEKSQRPGFQVLANFLNM